MKFNFQTIKTVVAQGLVLRTGSHLITNYDKPSRNKTIKTLSKRPYDAVKNISTKGGKRYGI